MSTPIYNKNWTSYKESETVWPFQRLNEVLDLVAVRLSPKGDWKTSTVVEPEAEVSPTSEDFSPEVQLNVDQESLLAKTGLAAEDLNISIHATDIAMKRTYPISNIGLDALTNGAEVRLDPALKSKMSLRRGLSVSIVAYSTRSKNGYDLGDKIAEKEIIIRSASDMSVSFPINKLDPSDEKWPADKYSPDTAWFIWWGDRTSMFDYDAPMEAVVRVYFNEQVHGHLDRLQKKGDSAHKMFWSQVSTEIFLELTAVYLASGETDEPDKSSNGFRAKFIRALKKLWLKTPGASNDSCAELVRQFKEDPDFLSKLRAVMQQKANFRALAENIPA